MKEIIKIELDDKLAKDIEIFNNKIQAIRSLFFSYMNNEYEVFDDLKFAEIFDEYSCLTMEYNKIIYDIIKNSIDSEVLDCVVTNRYNIRFSYLTKCIYITCDTNACCDLATPITN